MEMDNFYLTISGIHNHLVLDSILKLFVILLSTVCLLLVMPTLDYSIVSPKNAKKRNRSFSVSMAIEFPEHVERMPVYYKQPGYSIENFKVHRKSQSSVDRFRSFSSNYADRNRYFFDSELSLHQVRGKAMLKVEPDIFPFQSLPDDCKMLVFSKLSMKEKGIAAQVCSMWNHLMKTPFLWGKIDFCLFPLCYTCPELNRECSLLCYSSYKTRLKLFMEFLVKIKPCLTHLKFAFDIGDPKDGWLCYIERMIRFSKCHDLVHLDMDWKETYAKDIIAFKSNMSTWSYTDCKNFKFDYRHRQRLFTNFFDLVTAAAVNITYLTLPFHWSDRTLCALCRLKKLKTLVLKHYFWMQELDQTHLTMLLRGTRLVNLTLEVWIPTGPGFQSFIIDSDTLEHLDISPCRGLYLERVSLPKLKHLKVSRRPLFPPFFKVENPPYLACLHMILSEGAPNLISFNGFILPEDWSIKISDDLENILKNVCCCRLHRK